MKKNDASISVRVPGPLLVQYQALVASGAVERGELARLVRGVLRELASRAAAPAGTVAP